MSPALRRFAYHRVIAQNDPVRRTVFGFNAAIANYREAFALIQVTEVDLVVGALATGSASGYFLDQG